MTFEPRLRLLGILAISAFFGLLFLSCNDTGTSPYVPHISYKVTGIGDTVGKAMTPDSVVSDSGAVSSYAISPALPTGLTLNSSTGVISGTPTGLYPPTSHTVIATGPNGISRVVLNVCVGDSNNSCNINPPNFSYFPQSTTGPSIGPGFMWTSPNVAFTPDTPYAVNSKPGIISVYTISPNLPNGVTINSVTGIISGTPKDTLVAKAYTVVATGPFGSDTAIIYLAVYPSSFPFDLLARGQYQFEEICAFCHQNDGLGSVGPGPRLLHSDFLMASRYRPIAIQFTGLPQYPGIPGISGDTASVIVVDDSTIVANGPQTMGAEGKGLNDSDLAGVVTFVRNFLNGATDYISPAEAKYVRDSLARADTVGGNCTYPYGTCIDTTGVGY